MQEIKFTSYIEQQACEMFMKRIKTFILFISLKILHVQIISVLLINLFIMHAVVYLRR